MIYEGYVIETGQENFDEYYPETKKRNYVFIRVYLDETMVFNEIKQVYQKGLFGFLSPFTWEERTNLKRDALIRKARKKIDKKTKTPMEAK